FLGSTRKDLDADCRRAVLEAVKVAEAVAVEMGDWDADHVDAVRLCRQKLELESSHYVGVFAYWRGWEPKLKLSITQAESEWACGCRKDPPPCRMAVFVPNPCSDFDQKLRERAIDQTAEQAAAQKKFLERVSRDVYQVFDDPINLALKVQRTL